MADVAAEKVLREKIMALTNAQGRRRALKTRIARCVAAVNPSVGGHQIGAVVAPIGGPTWNGGGVMNVRVLTGVVLGVALASPAVPESPKKGGS